MYREITTGIRDVLDPEWDEVSRIIDFSNCWDDDKPTGDYLIFPTLHLEWEKARSEPWPKKILPKLSPLFEERERKPKPRPEIPEPNPPSRPIGSDKQKMLWWRHEMQEMPEEALARLYNLDPAALHEAIEDEWAVIYGFWGGTPEEFRAEMRRPENIDKHRT